MRPWSPECVARAWAWIATVVFLARGREGFAEASPAGGDGCAGRFAAYPREPYSENCRGALRPSIHHPVDQEANLTQHQPVEEEPLSGIARGFVLRCLPLRILVHRLSRRYQALPLERNQSPRRRPPQKQHFDHPSAATRWRHCVLAIRRRFPLRTSNPIESVFATVRQWRVRRPRARCRKEPPSFCLGGGQTWRRQAQNQLPKLFENVRFRNGVEVIEMPVNMPSDRPRQSISGALEDVGWKALEIRWRINGCSFLLGDALTPKSIELWSTPRH